MVSKSKDETFHSFEKKLNESSIKWVTSGFMMIRFEETLSQGISDKLSPFRLNILIGLFHFEETMKNSFQVKLNSLHIIFFFPPFQADSRRAEDEMRLYYVCTNVHCTHRWTEWADIFFFQLFFPYKQRNNKIVIFQTRVIFLI